jgi:hypothetical protein
LIQNRNLYLDFFDYLNAAGMRYAILHDWEALCEGNRSDVDLALALEDLPQFEALLHTRYRILNMLHYEVSAYGFVLAPKDHDLDSAFVADVITDYRWHGRVFFTDRELLRSRQQWNGFWVLAPRQEFAYLLVKKIYEKGTVPEHQRRRLEKLARELGPEAISVVSRLFGEAWGKQLSDWIVQGQWAEVEAHVTQLRGSLRRQAAGSGHFNRLRYWLPEMRRIWQRWRYPTGLAAAVVGPDESKRNELIGHLKEAFPEAFRRCAILPGVPRSYTCKSGHTPTPGAHQKLSHPAWLCWLTHLYSRLDLSLGFLFRVRPLLVRSTLVLYGGRAEDLLTSQLGCSSTIYLDGSQYAEEAARTARHVLSNYLCRRYLNRRLVWFTGAAPNIPH